jgi:hypothetical protein
MLVRELPIISKRPTAGAGNRWRIRCGKPLPQRPLEMLARF